jgi:hypothetical protein
MSDDTTLPYLEKFEQVLRLAKEIALDEAFLEELAKSCPRCGKPSANKSNPSGRCSACLKKLAANKKKPGHYLHEHKVADDALRRQKGKNGTAHKKSSGLGSRKSIINQTHNAEAKTGQVLSPDRKDNSKGYSASNTRMVPPELNRGRHHVDGKKLAAWKKRLKKSETTDEEFYTYILSKATEIGSQEELVEALKEMSPTETSAFLDNLIVE